MEGTSEEPKVMEWFDKYFNVSWKIAIPFCLFAVGCGFFMFYYTQTACDVVYELPLSPDTPMMNSPIRYNCSQLAMDYSCCRVKRSWQFWTGDTCIGDYQPAFVTQCLGIDLLDNGFALIIKDNNGTVIRNDLDRSWRKILQ